MVPGADANGLVAPRRAEEKELDGVIAGVSKRKGLLTTASLDGITSFPDHGADWARVHV